MIVQTRFYGLFKEKLEKAVDVLLDDLSSGKISGDDAATVGMHYRQAAGRLQGLREALALAEETNTEMNR